MISSTQNKRGDLRSLPDGLCFGNYQIARLIAIGGMSEVYEAIHNGLDKRVALKVMRPELAASEEARERFVSEGVNAARIQHTNVVDVTDVGIVDGLPYLVMSLLDGEDLGAVYARHGRLPAEELVDLLLPVTSAVAVGHAHEIVHRDLKPDNIYLHCEGCRLIPKVLDFGVSRAMNGRRITVNSTIFGTPQYMSPEQARGAATDARTDQYALGVILYEGVTGHLPRDSANPLELLHSIAFDSFQLPSAHVELPPELEAVILRAMAHDPEDRFASIRDFAIALLPFASPPARDYWSLELQSITTAGAGGAPLPAFGRSPTLPPQSLGRFEAPPKRPAPNHREVIDADVLTPSAAAALDRSRTSLQPLRAARRARRNKRQRSVFWIGALAGAFLGLAGVWVGGHAQRGRSATGMAVLAATPASRRVFEIDVRVEPPTAAVLLDGQRVGVGHFRTQLARNGTVHELRASADGYITRSVSFRDEGPPREIHLNPRDPLPALQPSAAGMPSTQAAPILAPTETSEPLRARGVMRKKFGDTKPARDPVTLASPVAAVDAPAPVVKIVEEAEPRVQIID